MQLAVVPNAVRVERAVEAAYVHAGGPRGVVRGGGIVVKGRRIGASEMIGLVAAVRVRTRVVPKRVSRVGASCKDARAVVNGCRRVVIVSTRVGAPRHIQPAESGHQRGRIVVERIGAQAPRELAIRGVASGRQRVVVRRRRIAAADDRKRARVRRAGVGASVDEDKSARGDEGERVGLRLEVGGGADCAARIGAWARIGRPHIPGHIVLAPDGGE